MFVPSNLKKILNISLFLNIFQQMTGISAVIYYAQLICLMNDSRKPWVCAFYTGLIYLVFSLINLKLIDLFNRTNLLKLSSCIMTFAHFGNAISNLVSSLMFYIFLKLDFLMLIYM